MSFQLVKIKDFIGHSQPFYTCCIDGDGKIYSAGGDGMVVRWNLSEEDGNLIATSNSAIYALCSNLQDILIGNRAGEFIVIRDSKILHRILISDHPIFHISMAYGQAVVLQGDGVCTVFNREWKIVNRIHLSSKALRSFTSSKEFHYFSGSEGKVFQTDHRFNLKGTFQAMPSTIFSMDYIHDSEELICGGKDAWHGQH